MPGAVIVADQPLGAGAGVPGVARNDLWLNRAIDLSVGTSGNSTYEWTILSKPLGSTSTLTSGVGATSSFTPDVLGTYRVRLITNGGGPGNVQIRVFRVRYTFTGVLANRGWVLPAFGESGTEENNYGGNVRGYAEPFDFLFSDLLLFAADVRGDNFVLSTEASSAGTTYQRQGVSPLIDMTKYPPVFGSRTRRVRFRSILENSIHTVNFKAEVRLFDLTHAVPVASTTLDNSAAIDRSIPAEYASGDLTVGSSSGNIRSDTPTLYSAQFRAVGVLGPSDRVILGGAYLIISYE